MLAGEQTGFALPNKGTGRADAGLEWRKRMNLVQMSLTAGILIVGIMAFRFFFVHRLPKGVMVLLWEIAILRLLLPFALPLPAPGRAVWK